MNVLYNTFICKIVVKSVGTPDSMTLRYAVAPVLEIEISARFTPYEPTTTVFSAKIPVAESDSYRMQTKQKTRHKDELFVWCTLVNEVQNLLVLQNIATFN